MRLVDADRITKILEEMQKHSLDGKINIENVLYLVEIQNTAYNIDKVVEELENQECEYQQYDMPTNDYECGFEGGCEYAFRKAIEIVKAGEEK